MLKDPKLCLLGSVLDKCNISYVCFDSTLTITDVNFAAAKLFNISRNELINKVRLDSAANSLLLNIHSYFSESCNSSKAIIYNNQNYILNYSTADHLPDTHIVTIQKLPSPDDFHETKRLRSTIEAVNDGYWDWPLTPSGEGTEYEYISPSLKAMMGYEDHELENSPKSWQKILYEEDLPSVLNSFRAHIDSGGGIPYKQNVRYIHKDGSLVHVICRGIALKNSKGEYTNMIGIHQDISDLVEKTEALEKATEKLENFNYIVTHDLNAPIRTISSFLQLLEENIDHKLGFEDREYLNFLKQGVERIKNLLASLQDYTCLDKSSDPSTDFTLEKVQASLETALYSDIKESSAQIHWLWDPSCCLHSNFHHICLIFQNLISNAIRYTPKDRTPEITVSSDLREDGISFSIADNGLGIADMHKEIIFAPFQRIKNNEVKTGTGMGLSIVGKLVENYGGKISVRDNTPHGTIFTFNIKQEVSHGCI